MIWALYIATCQAHPDRPIDSWINLALIFMSNPMIHASAVGRFHGSSIQERSN